MPLLNAFYGLVKKLILFIVIVSIGIPLWYGSTNPQYLTFRLLHSTLSIKHTFIADQARPKLSANYRAFEDIFRMKPPPDLDPLADPMIKVKELRERFSLGIFVPKPKQCQIKKEVFEYDGHKYNGYWIDNLPKTSDRIILYFHGGGYMIGDINGYGGFECHLSQLFNVRILHFEYDLSPENPFPDVVNDAVSLYNAILRKDISPSQILIMGDSAGGGLSLLTVQTLINQKLPLPRGVIILSPWTDVSGSSESYERNRHADVFLDGEEVKWIGVQIVGSNKAKYALNDPQCSPLFGSFKGFPPMYVNFGTAEVLEDDSRGVLKKARESGVDVTVEEGQHLMHVYSLFFPFYPEGRHTLENINKWIQNIFSK